MTKPSIVQYGMFGAAAGLGSLAVAYGFDAVGQTGLEEAIFRSDVYSRGAAACVHCGATTSPKLAENRPDVPVQ
jgi:hypothetical protein